MTYWDLILFIGKRLVALAILLFVFSLGVYALLDLAPGSAVESLAGGSSDRISTATLEALREQYHLNDPFFARYGAWLSDALQLDFGQSVRTRESVTEGITQRMGVSVFVGLYGFAIAMGLGLVLGIFSAVRRRTTTDRVVVGLSVIGLSTPAFASGIALIYLFAVVLGWFPAFGEGSWFLDRLWHMTLPAVALALTGMALVVKLTRAGMIEALEQDYVTFATARGLSYPRVVATHALRNALVPIITAGGNILSYMLTGAVLVEVTFALPGLGAWLVQSVLIQDIPVVQGVVLTIAVVIVLVNLLTDVLYLIVDPRIRFQKVAS